MKLSKKKYLQYIIQTIEAINNSNNFKNTFINNPGFGRIFDIIKSEKDFQLLEQTLNKFYGEQYSQTVLSSLKQASLTSYFTPDPLVDLIVNFLNKNNTFLPKTILEPAAGNGAFVKSLLKVFPQAKYTAFEKDVITSSIFSHNFQNNKNVTLYGIPFEVHANTDAPKTYDLIISNIPFGSASVFDPSISHYEDDYVIKKSLHGYFSFKINTLLNPKGIAVIITTKNLLDREKNQKIRQQIINQSNFIGGFRLPNDTFEKENTKVVTDLLFFQNNQGLITTKEQKDLNQLFIDTKAINVGDNKVSYSAYFKEYPENVLGEIIEGGLYHNKDYTIDSFNNSIEHYLSHSFDQFLNFKSIDFNLSLKSQETLENQEVAVETNLPSAVLYRGELQPGNIIVDQNKIAKISASKTLDYIKTNPLEFDKLSKIIHIRDRYIDLINESKIETFNSIQKELNYDYDLFFFQYGALNEKRNRHFVALDRQAPLILGLEKLEQKQYIKSDIFSSSQRIKESEVKIDSLNDAIFYSLNKYNRLDIKEISSLLNIPQKQIIEQGISEQLFYFDFQKNQKVNIVTSQEFFSGLIYQKIDLYKNGDFGKYKDYIDKSYLDKTIAKLEEVKPPITSFEDMDIKLHESWMPYDMVEDFIEYKYFTQVVIRFNQSSSKYMVRVESLDFDLTKRFTIQTQNIYYDFEKVLAAALNQSIPYVTKGDKDNKKTDKVKMTEFKIKFELLYKEFKQYVLDNPTIKDKIETIFYNKYEAHLNPVYDGKHLTFKGLEHFTPYNYQLNTTAGILQNEGLLVHKEVGFGKTLSMAISAMKLKELGISKKTLIVGLKPTLKQLESNFRNAFPNANLFVLDDKNAKTKTKREIAFANIAHNDYDIILMSHETFKQIPQSVHTIVEIIQNELNHLEKDLSVIHNNSFKIHKATLHGLERRKQNLTVELKEIYAKLEFKKDNTLDFESMKINHIMVDEYHKFKNLMYTTRHNRVGGLNTSSGSERSKNLLASLRTLQKISGKDYQASFFSGTPIKNSITEAYVIFKYLIPEKLKQLNIESFDQWAQMFANKTYEFEPTINGDFKVKERFREFKKLRLLASLYRQVSIIVNSTTHKVDKPQIVVEAIQIKPTKLQNNYFENIRDFINTGDSKLIYTNKNYDKDQLSAVSLIALHHMRYSSIDVRLLNQDLIENENNKLSIISEHVANTYYETNEFKGVQAIFSDIGTPKDSFNVYDHIKNTLIDKHKINPNEIIFIHDFKNDLQREQCFKDLNAGIYRIVIGSTDKLGTGTNFQNRLIHIHHVDIPFDPSKIDQRNGRGARPDNVFAKSHYNNQVKVNFYITKNTSDAVMLNHVNTKARFISQLVNGSIKLNSIDLGPIDDKGEMDYNSLLALAHDSPLFLEKENLKKELESLKIEKEVFKKNHQSAKFAQYRQKERFKNYQDIEKNLQIDHKDFPQTILEDSNYYQNIILINGKNFMKPKVLGKHIIEYCQEKSQKQQEFDIATFYKATLFYSHGNILVRTNSENTYGYGKRQLNKNEKDVAMYIKNALLKVTPLLKEYKELVEKTKKEIKGNQIIIDTDFQKQDQIHSIESRIAQINKKLDKIQEENTPSEDSKNDQIKKKNKNKEKQSNKGPVL